MASNEQPIIIKRVKKAAHAHHGGAWKIAYADFVTAMMAFFLLMWLISMTTPQQKDGLADYFAPPNISRSTSGSGGVLGGTAHDNRGAREGGSVTAIVMSIAPPADEEAEGDDKGRTPGEGQMGDKVARGAEEPHPDDSFLEEGETEQEARAFARAEMSIRQSLNDLPELAELSKHIIIDETPEGLRIQLVDQEGRSMFPAESAVPYERTRVLLNAIGNTLNQLPNRITIGGHTDANPLSTGDEYTSWELTSDRANAARRLLMQAGLNGNRVYQVAGKADSEPLFPEDPYMAANRRISIVLLREAPVLPPSQMR
ncbi:flagellar motor protein MotB [Pyruvatibacter sp.]|uniref:flagellar motor protein MotB n=1 Tax=Pyruvatibacter sp. TaxID=1981328 RepID=UPI0032ED8ABA